MKSVITLLSFSLLVSLACCVPVNAMQKDEKKAKKAATAIAAELTKKNAEKAKEETEKAKEDEASGSDNEASSSSGSDSEDEASKKKSEQAAKQLEEIKQKRQEAEKKAADARAKEEAAKARRDKAAAAVSPSTVPALEVLGDKPQIVAVVDASDPNAGKVLADKLAKSVNNVAFQKGFIAFKFGAKIGLIPVLGIIFIMARLKQNHDKGTLSADVAVPALVAGAMGQVVDYKALRFVLGLDYTALSTYCGLALIIYITYLVAENNMVHVQPKAPKKIVLEPTANGTSTPVKSEKSPEAK